MNIEDLYFDSLRKISSDVHKFIDIEINKLQKTTPKELFRQIQNLPAKRKGVNILRSVITLLVYKSLTKESNNNLIALCALSELNNYNAYLDNWILDNKNNVWETERSREKISYITIVSGVYRELVDKVTFDTDISNEQKLRIVSIIQSAMIRSYQGQARDMEMSIQTIDRYTTDAEYIAAYTEKSIMH